MCHSLLPSLPFFFFSFFSFFLLLAGWQDQEAIDFIIATTATFEQQVIDSKRKGEANAADATAGGQAAAAASSTDTTAAAGAEAAAATAANGSAGSGVPSGALTQAEQNEVLHQTSKALVREALDRRSLDNVTVLLIKL